MTPVVDLTAALAAHYAATTAPRGDELELHASDAWKCARDVWARRNGVESLAHDPQTRTKFALGNAVEDHVAEAIADDVARAGWTLARDVVVDFDGVVGHVDYVLERRGTPSIAREAKADPIERAVVEVKSTTFFPKMVNGRRQRFAPDQAKWHYRMQAATYALALGAEQFAIFIVCRESGMSAEFWYETAEYEAEVRARLAHLRALTAPGMPEPRDERPEQSVKWACAFCDHLACERNENTVRLQVPA